MTNTAELTLTDFLLDRIADDEAFARNAISATGDAAWGTNTYRVVASGEFEVADASVPSAAHIARHDPARVLAECEAKRLLLNDSTFTYGQRASGEPSIFAQRVMTYLALPYADHPDFRGEWRA